jgi:hypothetical protein
MEAVSWTVCAGDSFPEDDTARVKFLQRVTDVAVTAILAPLDTLDSGAVIWPRAAVWNYGNLTVSFGVEFTIDTVPANPIYCCTARVVNLIPGGQQEVVAPDSWVAIPGRWWLHVRLIMPGDLHPENNVMSDTFWVGRAPPDPDLWVQMLWPPPDTIDTTMIVVPACSVANPGMSTEQFWLFFRVIHETTRTVYSESTQLMLGAGGRMKVMFLPVRFTTLGWHVARCSVYCPDSFTLVCWRDFLVVPGPGIAEGPTPEGPRFAPPATLVRGVLWGGLGTQSQFPERNWVMSRALLLDAAGRTVMPLEPGPNDVRHLPSGVYFLRMASGEGRTANSKVVIQR